MSASEPTPSHPPIFRSDLPLPLLHRGKVREMYDAGVGPPPHGGLRPGLGVRCRHGRARPPEGRGPYPPDSVVARAARRRGRAPPRRGPGPEEIARRCSGRSQARGGRLGPPLASRPADPAAADRVRGARLPLGLGVAGIPGRGHTGRREASRRPRAEPGAHAPHLLPGHEGRRRPRPRTFHSPGWRSGWVRHGGPPSANSRSRSTGSAAGRPPRAGSSSRTRSSSSVSRRTAGCS